MNKKFGGHYQPPPGLESQKKPRCYRVKLTLRLASLSLSPSAGGQAGGWADGGRAGGRRAGGPAGGVRGWFWAVAGRLPPSRSPKKIVEDV